MDVSPTEKSWLATRSGAATFEVVAEDYRDNRTLRFQDPDAETSPGSVAKLSWSPDSLRLTGHLMFDFRLAEIGPYTQLTIAEIDFGDRALRFYLRAIPEGKSLSIQCAMPGSTDLLWERVIPDQGFFQQTRWLELAYVLDPGARRASVYVEGAAIIQDQAIDEDWAPLQSKVSIGAFGHAFPTSGSIFELDNVSFDEQLP